MAKVLPRKVKLLTAMDYSRRKTQVNMAMKDLDEAASLWPAWLSQEWLPFLRAALARRGGQKDTAQEWEAAARREYADRVGSPIG